MCSRAFIISVVIKQSIGKSGSSANVTKVENDNLENKEFEEFYVEEINVDANEIEDKIEELHELIETHFGTTDAEGEIEEQNEEIVYLPKIYCQYCGCSNDANVNKCSSCGAKFKNS